MALGTYSDLKTAISDHLDRDDLSSFVDDFIDLAEARHKDDIRFRPMLRRSQATVDDRYLTLPTGFLQMKTLRLLTDPVTVMTEVNLDEMNRQRKETTGKPERFTIHEEIEFDRAPDKDYTAEMVYYAELAPLSDNNTSNALLSRSPNAYLYAALVAAAPFLHDDERVPLWKSLYQQAIDGLTGADKRSRHGGSPVAQVRGPTP